MITTILSLVLTNNLAMSAIKWLADKSISRGWLRASLALLSIVGVVSSAALGGQPVNFDSISEWSSIIAQVVGVALFSHLSYKAVKNA